MRLLKSFVALSSVVILSSCSTTKSPEPQAVSPAPVKAPLNLVDNGSFEQPEMTRWGTLASIPGWKLASGPGIEVQSRPETAHSGRQVVQLDSAASSAIYQDVSTVAGEKYVLSFAVAGMQLPSTENQTRVLWGGNEVAVVEAKPSGTNVWAWEEFSYEVTGGPGQTTRLEFQDAGKSNGNGPFLDTVSVTKKP